MKRIIFSLLLVWTLLVIPVYADSIPPSETSKGDYEISYSTEYSGQRPIWVLREYPDVPKDHWFYLALQEYRRTGIITGDECGRVNLERPITEEELHTLLIRYIYASDFEGTKIRGAIYGDYTYNGHGAWKDAHEEVHAQMETTIKALGKTVELPEGQDVQITRKNAFVFYAMAELSRCDDPAWYFGQFSDKHLGYFARSNAPIYVYGTGQSVAGFFSGADHNYMTPLEIQSANMLMYLGVLDGTEDHTLAPNRIIMRGEGVKLLEGIDRVDTSPHVHDTDDGDDGDWGGSAGEYPEPEPPKELDGKWIDIMFVDWDNTHLGHLIVWSGVDVRPQVNAYVRENFVHPDLVDASPASLARMDNYRGQYSDDPVDGAAYPLTDHIDYAFVQQPFVKVGGSYIQTAEDYVDYPWAYGWVACTLQNYQDVWTTLGVGELASWDGKHFPAGSIEIADLERGFQDNVILKALYQPGPDLVVGGNYTATTAEPLYTTQHEYGKKVTQAALEEVVPLDMEENIGDPQKHIMNPSVPYFFNWTWSRVTYIAGKPYGVSRLREPHGKVYWDFFGPGVWPCEPYADRPFSLATLGQMSLLTGYSNEWLHIKDSPDDLNLAPAATMCFGMDAELVEGYQSNWYEGTVRSERMRSQAAHIRQTWYETEDTGAIYWSPTLGYYSILRNAETWDAMVARLCERIGKEACWRCGAYRQFDPELGENPKYTVWNNKGGAGKDIYLSRCQYMLISDKLRLPKELSSEYWETHTFTNKEMDAFTMCVWNLEEWITTNHPDVNDDEWWCDVWNSYYGNDKNGAYWPDSIDHTVQYRIPKISYHQLYLYWDKYYDWWFDGQDEATKPTPLSADVANAIPLGGCTLKDHIGICGSGTARAEYMEVSYQMDKLVVELYEE